MNLKQDINYIGHGAIYSTGTKADAVTRGLSVLKSIKQICKNIPVIAIGGINKTNERVAKDMLKKNLPLSLIQEISQLSENVILKLAEKLGVTIA